MTPMKPSGIAISALLMSSVAALPACHAPAGSWEDAGATEASSIRPLHDFVCNGTRYCHDFDYRGPELFLGSSIGITDCTSKQTSVLFGFWSIEDAASRPFDWSAEVRYGGVFPVLGHVATGMGCGNEHPQEISPEAIVAMDPDGFAWAKLEGDDVFIPFNGDATLDHVSRAKANLQESNSDAASRVKVWTKELHVPGIWHSDLGLGDSFPWGAYRAVVVRIVAPQDGVLGAIGWVEIRLSSRRVPGDMP